MGDESGGRWVFINSISVRTQVRADKPAIFTWIIVSPVQTSTPSGPSYDCLSHFFVLQNSPTFFLYIFQLLITHLGNFSLFVIRRWLCKYFCRVLRPKISLPRTFVSNSRSLISNLKVIWRVYLNNKNCFPEFHNVPIYIWVNIDYIWTVGAIHFVLQDFNTIHRNWKHQWTYNLNDNMKEQVFWKILLYWSLMTEFCHIIVYIKMFRLKLL